MDKQFLKELRHIPGPDSLMRAAGKTAPAAALRKTAEQIAEMIS